MKTQKKQFRIGELAKKLNVEKFVVRFWEKEFNLKPHRSTGGQRFYQEQNVNTFKQIKELLYEQGFTITGAKKILKQKNNTHIIASQKIVDSPTSQQEYTVSDLSQQIINLQKQLIKLREML